MRIASSFFALLAVCAAASAAPQLDPEQPTLTLPDGSIMALPPGTRAFGPNGPVVPEASEPPSAIAAPPPKDAPPAPSPSATERRKQRLDELYGRLAQAKDSVEAEAIGGMIANLSIRSGSDTGDLLMSRAVASLEGKDYPTAAAILDKLVVLRPKWAEAWNKRATVRYLEDDDMGAMADIGQVLLLEPRHFGALSGMGLILHRNGNDKGALTVFRKAQSINPRDPQVKTLIDQLVPDVEGHDL